MDTKTSSLLKDRKLQVVVIFFVVFVTWRIWLLFNISATDLEKWHSSPESFWWGALYQLIAIFGGVFGFLIAKHWGGFKSTLGRALSFISFGLLLQAFGQTVITYYVYFQNEALYPSIADIGFFGSVLFYIYGVIVLARASGLSISIRDFFNKIQSILIPFGILLFSYFAFLKDYNIDYSNPVKVFLDFGYPLGQAFYISVVVLIFFTLRRTWGGLMKNSISFLLCALLMQYLSDFTFLYQSNKGSYVPGGIVDFMYLTSYFLMSFSLIFLGNTFSKIEKEKFIPDSEETKNFSLQGIKSVTATLNQIILAIIKRQEKVAGQIAWEEAKKVDGLKVVNQVLGELVISTDSKEIIDRLVSRYQNLFGDLAVEVSKDAARHLLAELPAGEIPNSLK